LLIAVAERMAATYPMDSDFVMELPPELLPVFNQWARTHDFIPSKARPSWSAREGKA
jgi:hypothetical protein